MVQVRYLIYQKIMDAVPLPIYPTFRRLVNKEDNIFDKEHQKTGESIAFPGLSW